MRIIKNLSFLLILMGCGKNYNEINYDSDNVKKLRIRWNQNDTLYIMSYLDSINRLHMSDFVLGLEDIQNVSSIYFPVFNETYIWSEMDSMEIVKYKKFAYCSTKGFIRNSRYMKKLSESNKDTLLYNRYGTWTYTDTLTLSKMEFDIDSLCREIARGR